MSIWKTNDAISIGLSFISATAIDGKIFSTGSALSRRSNTPLCSILFMESNCHLHYINLCGVIEISWKITDCSADLITGNKQGCLFQTCTCGTGHH